MRFPKQTQENDTKRNIFEENKMSRCKQRSSISLKRQPNQRNNFEIQQLPTEERKKGNRNKDRLQHLQNILPFKERWNGYLDVGCGNAEISTSIACYLQLSTFYGTDMFSEEDLKQPESIKFEAYPKLIYKQNKENILDIPSNSVDLVTCFMAIHHFKNLDKMLKEIKRILNIDGYLFIREHNVPRDNFQLKSYIEDIHNKYPDNPTDGFIRLFEKDELKQVLNQYGFSHLKDSLYNGVNPQAIYHSIFILQNKLNLKELQAHQQIEQEKSISVNSQNNILEKNQLFIENTELILVKQNQLLSPKSLKTERNYNYCPQLEENINKEIHFQSNDLENIIFNRIQEQTIKAKEQILNDQENQIQLKSQRIKQGIIKFRKRENGKFINVCCEVLHFQLDIYSRPRVTLKEEDQNYYTPVTGQIQ